MWDLRCMMVLFVAEFSVAFSVEGFWIVWRLERKQAEKIARRFKGSTSFGAEPFLR